MSLEELELLFTRIREGTATSEESAKLMPHFAEWGDRLRQLFRGKYGCSCDEAEDLSQQTFLNALKNSAGRCDASCDKNSHGPWAFLLAIAKNLGIDHFRRRAAQTAFLQRYRVLLESRSSSERMPEFTESEAILKDLPALDRREQLVLECLTKGLTAKEVAELPELSEYKLNADLVRQIKRRAISYLRDLLREAAFPEMKPRPS